MLAKLFMAVGLAVVLAGAANAKSDGARDHKFIKEAIKGNNAEIALGQLASEKGSSADVREFGQMLATDHGQGKKDASAVAEKLGVKTTDEMPGKAKKEMKKLQGLSGAAFDKEFAKYMVSDHKEDIAKYQKEADKGSGDAADLARKTLPTLRKHLETAQSLAK